MSTLGWSSMSIWDGGYHLLLVFVLDSMFLSADWADRPVNRGINTRSMIGSRGVVLDMLFNPLGFTRKYNWDSNVGFNLFAGYEYGQQKIS